jgi:hypothetical protein
MDIERDCADIHISAGINLSQKQLVLDLLKAYAM